MIELAIHSVLYSLLTRHRIVLLKEVEGERYLPIWIGVAESDAIATRLQGASVPRPLTHDLMLNVISELQGTVHYVLVNDLANDTFYARIAIEHDGDIKLVDSRPSDAIALAVRASAPIYAEEHVMERAAILQSPDIRGAPTPASGLQDDELRAFRDFVDTLDLDKLGDG
jgi:bifunctional DNase/RNase